VRSRAAVLKRTTFGFTFKRLQSKALECLQIPGSQGLALGRANYGGGNDQQIEATYTPADIEKMLQG
jgi:hypothetical protein